MWAVFKIQGFVCKRFLPSFLPLHSSPCNSLLPNCTETLPTQANSYEDRFAFACAFGATTTRCLTVLLLDNYYVIFHPKMYAWTIDPAIPGYTESKFITHNTRILFHKAHLYKSIRFIFTCEKSLYSQSELRTAISHVEV